MSIVIYCDTVSWQCSGWGTSQQNRNQEPSSPKWDSTTNMQACCAGRLRMSLEGLAFSASSTEVPWITNTRNQLQPGPLHVSGHSHLNSHLILAQSLRHSALLFRSTCRRRNHTSGTAARDPKRPSAHSSGQSGCCHSHVDMPQLASAKWDLHITADRGRLQE